MRLCIKARRTLGSSTHFTSQDTVFGHSRVVPALAAPASAGIMFVVIWPPAGPGSLEGDNPGAWPVKSVRAFIYIYAYACVHARYPPLILL